MPFDLEANIAFQKRVDKLEKNLDVLASELPEAFPFLSIVGKVHYTNSWRRTAWLERFTNGKTYPLEFNKTASQQIIGKNFPRVAAKIAAQICNELYGDKTCGADILPDKRVSVTLTSEVGCYQAYLEFDPLNVLTLPLSQNLSLAEACVAFVNEALDYDAENECDVGWRFLSGCIHNRVVVVSAPVDELEAWGIEYPALGYDNSDYEFSVCPT